MTVSVRTFLLYGFMIATLSVFGQLNEGGQPLSFTHSNSSDAFQHISLSPPDVSKLLEEDRAGDDSFRSERFAVLVPVGLDPLNSGTWEALPGGSSLWRLKLSLEGSLGSSLYFTGFDLPEQAKLFVYNEDKEELKGAFTWRNNQEVGMFATELIYSSTVVIELNVPPGMEPGNWFTLSEMTYCYGDHAVLLQADGFGDSQFCEVNINCSPEGDNWQDEKKGVVRIQVRVNGSAYWCTGSMINNTSMDKTPYLLTADHCAYKFGKYATPVDLATWLFYFNYESGGCADPQLEPQLFSMTGCEKIAHDGTHGSDGSDFYLVKLFNNIPASYNVYFNGWSTVDVPSSSGVTIHHPDGDIKKISTYLETPTTSSWQSNGLPSHWKVIWAETTNNWGVTEGGSSGAPLFDNIGRVVGTLTGGLASCSNPALPDYYGKFSYHWESNGIHDTTQLKPWLDPGNTGVLSLSGIPMGEEEWEIRGAEGFYLYPNPASDEVTVVFGTPASDDFRLEILDLFGNVLFSKVLRAQDTESKVRVDDLKPGIYFVRRTGSGMSRVIKMMKR